MAQHARLKVDAGVQVYFCDPQSPWQRGTNENGLLRHDFPKRTDLSAHRPQSGHGSGWGRQRRSRVAASCQRHRRRVAHTRARGPIAHGDGEAALIVAPSSDRVLRPTIAVKPLT